MENIGTYKGPAAWHLCMKCTITKPIVGVNIVRFVGVVVTVLLKFASHIIAMPIIKVHIVDYKTSVKCQ